MIRMIQSNASAHAKAYFSEALSKPDYYINDQELQGRFFGKLAERLGIDSVVTKDAFYSLCDNLNPNTGQPLTVRIKQQRITGYDINFHAPKSVSILHVLAKDNHILDAFNRSVLDTMRDIEANAKTRVRKNDACEERATGELIWAEFVHQTARPVEGHDPDMHLHSHQYVFNCTWDEVEKKYKAATFRDTMRDMPYYQAMFHKRLADHLVALGYQVKKAAAQAFEVVGVPQPVVDHFSKRTDQIGRVANEKGIHEAKALAELGAKTRSKKQKGLSMAELKAGWLKQMQAISAKLYGENNRAVRFGIPTKHNQTPKQCIDHALSHHFERASVMGDRRVLEQAYRHAIGNTEISIDDITREFEADDRLLHIKQGSRRLTTTREVLKEERRIVHLARNGIGKHKPLYLDVPPLKLKDQQANAVAHVLTTTNRVSIIRGAAGTGKTTLMKEAIDLIEQTGKRVVVVAPTAEASRGVLRSEGFRKAETVARLLADKELQNPLYEQVIWCDEAGLLGTKDMLALLELATYKKARLILGGDTRQHSSVTRGDSLRILNTVAGIKTAEVSKIYRQKSFRYRDAVDDLSKGNISGAFAKLDAMRSIHTVDPLKPHEKLVNDYVGALKKKKSALVISPTHKQGEEVTDAIRAELRRAKKIGKREIAAKKYSNLNMTEAEKKDWRNYKKGQVIQFNQNLKGFKRGSIWTVKAIGRKSVAIESEKGTMMRLPRFKSEKFSVYQEGKIQLAKGDRVKITRNGFDKKKDRLNNGMTLDVVSVNKSGKIILQNKSSKMKFELDADYGHIAHAHCVTSHASQGKTVDEVFVFQPSSTFGATDLKQFYVSVSRGRYDVNIYTDDKAMLLEYASEMGDRQSALELVQSQNDHVEFIQQLERNQPAPLPKSKIPEKEKTIDQPSIELDYEPGF